MTLLELKKRVDAALKHRDNENLIVCIPNNKISAGPLATTEVINAYQGFDWDNGKFFISPAKPMVER